MDEFELFRAQAYSGGIPSSPLSASSSSSAAAAERSSQYLHEYTSSGSSNARRRRHSSAIVGQEAGASEPGNDSAHPQHHRARDRRHRLLAGTSGQHHQSLDQCGSYDVRDAVVTVAVEPPSPTETRRQINMTSFSSSSTSTSVAVVGDMERIVDSDDFDDDFDDAGDMVVRSNSKPNKSPLVRRVTSPEAVLRPEVTSEVDNPSITEPIAEDCSSQPVDTDYDILRSYLLPLPAVTGPAPGQQSMRNSICSDGNSLQPASVSGSPRRNSCTGIVQSSSSLPLSPPPRSSSRRNSAVTYLPDMPQGRTRSGLLNIQPIDHKSFLM